MKAKAKLILKSLADLPANTVHLVALSSPVQVTRRQIRVAGNRSLAVMQSIYDRANAPFRTSIPWARGGLNE